MTCQQRKAALAMAIDAFETRVFSNSLVVETAETFFQFITADDVAAEATEDDIADFLLGEFIADDGSVPLWSCLTEDSHGDEALVEPYVDAEGGWVELCIKNDDGIGTHQYSPEQARQLADVLIEAAKDAEKAGQA